MKNDAPFAAQRADGTDVLDDARLVVDVHERDELRVGAQCLAHLVRLHDAMCVGSQVGDFEPFSFELFQGIEDGLVFRACRYDVSPAIAAEADSAQHGEVVRFSCSGSPDDAVRACTDAQGNLCAGPFHERAGATAEFVAGGGRVAVGAARTKTFDHRVRYARIHWCGCRVVEIDGGSLFHGRSRNKSSAS